MKLNKQIISVTLASTMILSSTSVAFGTGTKVNGEEVSVEESVNEISEKQDLEVLNKAVSALEKAEQSSLQSDLDQAEELTYSLVESEDKYNLIDRLKVIQDNINKNEEINKNSSKNLTQEPIKESKTKAIKQIKPQENKNIDKDKNSIDPLMENKNNLTNKLTPTLNDLSQVEEDKSDSDKEISNQLIDKIDSLPVSFDLTIKHKQIVDETIKDYNNLTENQKNFIKSKDVNKLLAAEDKVNKLEEQANIENAKQVDRLINSLNTSISTDNITRNYIDKVQTVKEAYNDLNKNSKSLVSKYNVDKLKLVTGKVDEKKAIINSTNKKIKALPNSTDVSEHGQLILQAKKSYESLSDASKYFIGKDLRLSLDRSIKNFKLFTKDYFPNLDQAISKEADISKKRDILKTAQANLEVSKQLDMSEARISYYQKTIDKAKRQIDTAQRLSNKKAAENIDVLISQLSKSDSISQSLISDTKSARDTYNSLNDNAKSFVLESNLDTLDSIEAKISKVKQSVKSIEDKILTLSDTKDILRHGKAILNVKKTYDALADDTKNLVSEESKSLLEEAIKNFKSFNHNDLYNLNQSVSQESDLIKKQEIIDLAEENLNLITEIGIEEAQLSHYKNLISKAKYQIHAANVDDLIANFDESINIDDITEEYMSKVYKAKRAYDLLPSRAKDLIAKASVEKLERVTNNINTSKEKTIDNLNELIASIPQSNTISKELVSKIERARESYQSLNDDERKLITKSNIDKLSNLEKIEVEIKEVKSILKPVEDRISLLPENRSMLGYGKAILKAKEAYSSLPDEAKNLMSESSNNILNGALMDFKSFTDRNVSSLNQAISKEVNLDKKQDLIDISQKSLNFVKELDIGNEKVSQQQKIINEAQDQVDSINKEIESKKIAIKVDKLIASFDEVTSLEDITKDYISKVEVSRKAYNSLDLEAKKLVSDANLKKLQRIEIKLANAKKIVRSVESKILSLPTLPTDKEILDNYKTILETKNSYDNLSDTAKSFVNKDLESSLAEIIKSFNSLIKDEIIELQSSILSRGRLKSKRNLVNKIPYKLEQAKSLGMDESEYNNYKSIINESEKLVSDLEEKSIKLKKSIIKSENAIANLSEEISIDDEEELKAARDIVNETLSLDESVNIKGIEVLDSLESDYKELKKELTLDTINSLNENNTEEQVKSTLQLLSDYTSDFDDSIIKDKNITLYLDSLTESTIDSASKVQDLLVDVNDTVAKLEAAIEKAESAINNLPEVEDIRIEDKMQVVNAKALIESVKVFDENARVKDQEKTVILDEKITELEEARKVEDKISNLVTLDKVTLENKPVAEEALEEYKKLTIYQQSLVDNIDDLFSVKSELEDESNKSQQAITAIEKAKETNSEKDIAMAKALINTLSQDEDKENLASELNVVEDKLNKTEDEKIIDKIKADLKFATQISDTIVKPEDQDGVSFKLNVSNIKGAGLIRDAKVNSKGDIDITREVSTRFSFDMTVTIEKGQVVDTKVFDVLVDGKLWPGNNMTTIKVKE